MKHLKILLAVIALLSASACSTTGSSGSEPGHGYWTNAGGKVWKSGFGKCWGSSSRNPELLGEDCGVAAPQPEAPEVTGEFLVPDGDNDGVRDEYDLCPFTPEGVEVDENGCALDNDGDGVPDYLDKCPETPLGDIVDEKGCSRVIATLEGVHFNFDSATLTSEAKSILDQAAVTIKSHGGGSYLVEGHTDSTGSDDYNMNLSQRRAESVANYLKSLGVSASLSAVGKGESQPVTGNDTASGRAMNRRVNILTQ